MQPNFRRLIGRKQSYSTPIQTYIPLSNPSLCSIYTHARHNIHQARAISPPSDRKFLFNYFLIAASATDRQTQSRSIHHHPRAFKYRNFRHTTTAIVEDNNTGTAQTLTATIKRLYQHHRRDIIAINRLLSITQFRRSLARISK